MPYTYDDFTADWPFKTLWQRIYVSPVLTFRTVYMNLMFLLVEATVHAGPPKIHEKHKNE